jgi:hypothetical protein
MAWSSVKVAVHHLVRVECDSGDVVRWQHSSVEEEHHAVQEALGPPCDTLTCGEIAVAGGFPVGDKQRSGLFGEADVLFDLANGL